MQLAKNRPDTEGDTFNVAIIGSGFSGIAAAAALLKEGLRNFDIFESSSGAGGTWWHSRYPGAAVDLESHIYSFPFHRWNWSRTHADRAEIGAYLGKTIDLLGVRKHISFETRIAVIRWSDEQTGYYLETGAGTQFGPYNAVISAVGFLSLPSVPDWANTDRFDGVICHTANWPEDLDLRGKRVGVVGTGSSAVQVAPEAAKVASEVKVFQRHPNWILPKGDREYSKLERRLSNNRIVGWLLRALLFIRYDLRQIRASHARTDGRINRKRYRAAKAYLERSFPEHPELKCRVTPDFPFEGKRTVINDTYYEALKKPNVTVVPCGVESIQNEGPVDAHGDLHTLDVVVLATGFQASNYLGNLTVIGPDGTELHDVWNGEPEAYLGMMMPGFPNLFMMYGPNTNGIPLTSLFQAQAKFIAKSLSELRACNKSKVQVARGIHDRYNHWLQKRLSETVWAQVQSYFRSGSGKIVSQWPFTSSLYIALTRLTRRWALKYK